MASTARPDELDSVVAMIAGEQRRPERTIIYLGDQVDGIRAELDALSPDWRTTVRVAHGPSGELVGASVVEWDEELGRAWVQGPWVVGADGDWARWARPLFDAAVAQIPPAIVRLEMSGTTANTRLAELAADLGWTPSVTNFAYVLDVATTAGWPAGPDDAGLRAVVADDLPAIEPLHEAEFPASYFSATQLVARAAAGEQIVLVAEGDDGSLAGYAAGQVQPDGEGYIDFVAVAPSARGTGVGRRLIVGLVRQLLPATTNGRISLTVQEQRTPARALYSSLGFREDAAVRGYRTGFDA
ncbi:MAG: GNAT family N-acetyltransferase [Ilumatobacteraceae bacterium]